MSMNKIRKTSFWSSIVSGCLASTLVGAAVFTCSESAIAQQPATQVKTDGFPAASPESQGMSAEALDNLAHVVQGYLDKDMLVGGELLVIKNRHVVLHKVFGDRDREDSVPWVENTICNIRSMTKPLTGAAAQILIDRGELSLDDPVSKYLQGFDTDEAREITVRQLMEHRAGLPLSIMMRQSDMSTYDSLIEQANAVGAGGPEFEPDSKFWYSDAGSDTVAAIVEVVSGMKIDDFWQQELFGPLGMNDTFVPKSKDDPRYSRIASLYAGAPHMWNRFWTANDDPFYPFAWGSQTVYSTPMDYARFLAMWMDEGKAGDRQVLSPAAVGRTLKPSSPMSMLGSDERYPTDFSGLELWYGRMAMMYMPTDDPTGSKPVIIGHGGSDGTTALAWPAEDLMVLYFTQSRGGMTVLRIEEHIDSLILHPDRVKTVAEVPDEFKPFVGTYIANFGPFRNEEFTVQMKNGKLALDIPSQMVFELLPPNDEGKMMFAVAPQQVGVTFEIDDTGTANLLKLHQSGMVFDIPRKGSKLAEEMAKLQKVDPKEVAPLLGTYHDPEADADLEVFLEDNVLSLKAPPGIVFHLVKMEDDPSRWQVKELSVATLTFETDDSGAVVSMTRHINGETLVMPRKADEPDEPADDDDDEG